MACPANHPCARGDSCRGGGRRGCYLPSTAPLRARAWAWALPVTSKGSGCEGGPWLGILWWHFAHSWSTAAPHRSLKGRLSWHALKLHEPSPGTASPDHLGQGPGGGKASPHPLAPVALARKAAPTSGWAVAIPSTISHEPIAPARPAEAPGSMPSRPS